MELYMYQRSKSFFDLCPRSLRMKQDLRWAIQDQCSSGFSMTFLLVKLWSYIINNRTVADGNNFIVEDLNPKETKDSSYERSGGSVGAQKLLQKLETEKEIINRGFFVFF